MRSALDRQRRLVFITVAAVAMSGLAACGGASGRAPGPAIGGASSPRADSGAVFPVTQSRLYYLTKLTGSQLCGLLHPGEPAQIAGGPTSPGAFEVAAGLSISCHWIGSADEFGISISKVENWQETRTTDLLVTHAARLMIDGHPAIDFGVHVDVAAAGPSDPAITFYSRVLAEAIKLARIVMPRLLAIGRRP